MDVQIGFNIVNDGALLVFVHSISECCSSDTMSFGPEQLSSIQASATSNNNDPQLTRLTICDPESDQVLFTSSTITTHDSSHPSLNIPKLMAQFRSNVHTSKTCPHRNYPQCFSTMFSIHAVCTKHFETRTLLIGFNALAFVLEQTTAVAPQQQQQQQQQQQPTTTRINISCDTLPKSSTSLSPPISPVDASGASKIGKRSSRPWEEDEPQSQSEIPSYPHSQQDDSNTTAVHKRNSIPSISDMLPSIQAYPLEHPGPDIRSQAWPSTATTTTSQQLPTFIPSFSSTTTTTTTHPKTFERRQSTYLETHQPQVPSPSTTPQSIIARPQVSSSSHYNSRLHVHQPPPQRQQVHYIIQQKLNTNDATPHKPIQLPPHFHPSQTQSPLSLNATYPPPQHQAAQVIDSKSPSPSNCNNNRDDDDGSGTAVSVGKPRPLKDGECKKCGVTSSQEWRKGPHGAKTLCNACGLRYKRKPWDLPVA
ncbi:hypothetical protein BJ741DRAFT_614311 [Chytriomyces cf. hyalinus JEL632]|nr:hypothetical protein BJ741DRAFT_614311 [Chytriomyces cf. hyalinus JEL632]